MLNRFEVFVELIHQRYAGRNVQFEDRFFAHVVEVFHQRTQGVTVSGDNDALAAFQARQNGFVPVRYDAVNGQRQALGGRQFRIGQLRVTRIVARITFVIFGQFRRGDGKAATPLFNLLVAILFSGFGFVQALQRAVVTFVQFPGFLDRKSVV